MSNKHLASYRFTTIGRRPALRLVAMAAVSLLVPGPTRAGAAETLQRTLAVVADFRQQAAAELPPHAEWRWSAEQKANAATFSRMAIAPRPDGKGQVLRIEVTPGFPWSASPERMLALTSSHFPPESDAIVLRVRVESGAFTIAIGGPTAYFGDSDVMTAPQRVEAGDWQDLRCDLNEGLCRNFRRAGFSRAATAITYNRWSQEPPGLYVLPGSAGVLLLETATLVASGRGRPFPVFDEAAMTSVQAVPTTLANAFTLLMADSQVADFERSWREPQSCQYGPPQLAATPGPATTEPTALSTTTRWIEEIRWAGVRTEPAPGANALVLSVRVTPETASKQLTSEAGQPIDVGLLCGSADAPFPWTRLGPPDEWRQAATVPGYDLNLSNRAVTQQRDLHVAVYQARRFVRTGEWQTLAIPFEDFACIAATGKCREHLVAHAAPTAGSVSGVVWLLPWTRGGRAGAIALEVADVRLATISADNGTPRRSYPTPVAAKLEALSGLSAYGGWVQATPQQ